jgi:predicted TPR repeat methyltransferase
MEMEQKEEYFSMNSDYLVSRKSQIDKLLEGLASLHSLKGDKMISVGCGVAPEMSLLSSRYKRRTGIDTNPLIIEFCSKEHDAEFVCSDALSYLDRLKDGSVDTIFALDIDTNMLPVLLARTAMQKLRSGGTLLLTERENNINIYNSLLLAPFEPQMRREFHNTADISTLKRFNNDPVKEDRDNFVMLMRKR